jgi:ADP-L-glycero-D-manno-heptose 6-epimerase
VIVVTGAAGFIGSTTIWHLNTLGYSDVLAVDMLGADERWKNLNGLAFCDLIRPDALLSWLQRYGAAIHAIIHLGACTSTYERDVDFLLRNNYEYSKCIWEWCTSRQCRLIYASSASTYGDGDLGYAESIQLERLRPLNPYGWSKHLFDRWALAQSKTPERWAGLKLFNVYGPNEYHKGQMMSTVLRAYRQVVDTGEICLFESGRPDIPHGLQERDFIYSKDVARVIGYMLECPKLSGIFNVGTGEPRSFNDLARILIGYCQRPGKIRYIPLPEEIRSSYQYGTCADCTRLRRIGYDRAFLSLEDGIGDYVAGYLERGQATLAGLATTVHTDTIR